MTDYRLYLADRFRRFARTIVQPYIGREGNSGVNEEIQPQISQTALSLASPLRVNLSFHYVLALSIGCDVSAVVFAKALPIKLYAESASFKR